MNAVLATIVFSVVLFVYLHIYYHLKTSDDLSVYEVEQPSKERLEEVCDIRQPVLFDHDVDNILENCNLNTITEHYGAFDVNIRNVRDSDGETYIPLALEAANVAFEQDKQSTLLTENNMDFLEETGLIKHMRYNDSFLRPSMVSNCYYDILTASSGTRTPFRYELNYRNYIVVTQGSVNIKLSSPKSSKYLHPTTDYDNFEFSTPIDPWNPQHQYKAEFSKVHCLEITLTPGRTFYLPAYWWYSIEFSKNTSICMFKYRTYMNNVAILPHIFMSLLQRQNTTVRTAKVIDDKEPNKNHKIYVNQRKNEANVKHQTDVIDVDNVNNNEQLKQDTSDLVASNAVETFSLVQDGSNLNPSHVDTV